MRLAEALDELGRRHGADGLALDGDGRCALALGGGRHLLVDHRPGSGAVFLRLALEVPDGLADDALARLYRRLLEANLLGQGTAGAVFSLDAEEEAVELHRRVPLDDRLEAGDLDGHLAALLGAADRLAAELGLAFAAGDTP